MKEIRNSNKNKNKNKKESSFPYVKETLPIIGLNVNDSE